MGAHATLSTARLSCHAAQILVPLSNSPRPVPPPQRRRTHWTLSQARRVDNTASGIFSGIVTPTATPLPELPLPSPPARHDPPNSGRGGHHARCVSFLTPGARWEAKSAIPHQACRAAKARRQRPQNRCGLGALLSAVRRQIDFRAQSWFCKAHQARQLPEPGSLQTAPRWR